MSGVRIFGSGQVCFWISLIYGAIGYPFTTLE